MIHEPLWLTTTPTHCPYYRFAVGPRRTYLAPSDALAGSASPHRFRVRSCAPNGACSGNDTIFVAGVSANPSGGHAGDAIGIQTHPGLLLIAG